MMTDTPEGFGFYAGRSTTNARAILAAADKVGVDRREVYGDQNGYYAPDAVIAELEKSLTGGKAEAEPVVEEQAPEQESVPAPAKNASKAKWSEWAAQTQGYDPAEDLSRDDLIERYV